MKPVENFRERIIEALQVMQKQREAISEDMRRHYSGIFFGLHETESAKLRALYFEAYQMEWLDSHWTEFAARIRHRSRSEQRSLTKLFAEFFSQLLELPAQEHTALAAAPEFIHAQQAALQELIEMTDEWDERSNQLEVAMKKHKGHYKKLIEEARKKMKEVKNGTA